MSTVTFNPEHKEVLDTQLLQIPGVVAGSMFGYPVYYIHGKLFACIYREGVGIKVPENVGFIEYMDVGSSHGWRLDEVVPSAEIVRLIDAEMPLEPIDPNYPGEVAERWRYRDGGGEIGVISSVTQAFCGSCTRARLSTEGMLYLCLFAGSGYDLRRILRGTGGTAGADDATLAADIAQIWSQRADRYSELRSEAASIRLKVEMSYIGG